MDHGIFGIKLSGLYKGSHRFNNMETVIQVHALIEK